MKFTSFKYAVAALTAALALGACNDVVDMNDGWDDDLVSDGAPSIRKITTSADTTTVISVAALDQSIAVFGDNLTDLESVAINDLELDLKEVFAKRHRLELIVPRKLPGTVTNTLRIVTRRGEVSAPLEVTLPELKIDGFENDFAADCDTVRVMGREFDLYGIDTVNATLSFNGQPVDMIAGDAGSFSIRIPEGTPTDAASYLTIEPPELATPVEVPFREPGIPILTNDDRTWGDGWWPTGITEVKEDTEPAAPMFRWIVWIKKNFAGTWGYENVMITHFWLDDTAADLVANPDDWCVKMEILNPAGTPLARYVRLGIAESEAVDKLYMWDPASSNDGVALNTMGEWRTVSFEVADLFPALAEGDKTSLKIAEEPYVNKDERLNFKVAMQREEAGDVEFYFWNLRFVKKIAVK